MKIVFLGNCQLFSLQRVHENFVTPATGDETRAIDPRGKLTPEQWQAITEADLVVDQVTDIKPPNTLDDVSYRGRRVTVPAAGAAFLWPYGGQRHPDSIARYGKYDPFRAEMGDAWLARALKAGEAPHVAAARYLALDVAAAAHLDRRYEMEMGRQRVRDAQTGFRTAELIERHFRDERLFLTPYHPGVRVARYLALTFLDKIEAPAASIDLVQRLMTDNFFLKFELPVHPAVARHFSLAWANEATRYRFHDETRLTFAEFAGRFMRCEADGALNEAITAVMQRRPGAAALIETACGNDPQGPWAMQALAIVRMEQQRFAEAERLLQAAVGIEPDLDYGWLNLGEALRGQDDKAAALAAFQKEVVRAPFRHATRFVLAHGLAQLGRYAEAIEQVDAALMLAPDKPQYVAFRERQARWAGS